MKKGENNMKKLMILAAVAAMAVGAQAAEGGSSYSYSYNFSLTVKNIPVSYKSLSENAVFYLQDKNSKNVLAYAYVKDFDFAGKIDPVTGITYLKATQSHDADNVTLDGKSLTTVGHALTTSSSIVVADATSGESDQKNVIFTLDFTTSDSTLMNNIDNIQENGNADLNDNIVAILSDTQGTEPYYLEISGSHIGVTGADLQTAKLSASSPYAVPEPTSAMLLLLGVAGLALKRKQVA